MLVLRCLPLFVRLLLRGPSGVYQHQHGVQSKRNHHPVCTNKHRELFDGWVNRVERHRLPLFECVELTFECLNRPLPGVLDPIPHRTGTDGNANHFLKQLGGGFKWHENSQQASESL